jgi:hypothetical protein
MGLMGNLTTGEILEQLVAARELESIRNVVFMVRFMLQGVPLDLAFICSEKELYP